ncbi:MAG: hypothetical protein GX774_21125 [Armatimonadetes bacterium]|nr:hypothetical protein [Armatimonadota bacterium]
MGVAVALVVLATVAVGVAWILHRAAAKDPAGPLPPVQIDPLVGHSPTSPPASAPDEAAPESQPIEETPADLPDGRATAQPTAEPLALATVPSPSEPDAEAAPASLEATEPPAVPLSEAARHRRDRLRHTLREMARRFQDNDPGHSAG